MENLNSKLKFPEKRIKLSRKMAVFDLFFKFDAFFPTVLIIFNPRNLYLSERKFNQLFRKLGQGSSTLSYQEIIILASRETELCSET